MPMGVRCVVTLMDAPESQLKHAAVTNPPGFSPCPRPLPRTAPGSSTSPAHPSPGANSLRFELLFVELQSCLAAALATATIGPHTPLRRSTLPATRSFAGSAHSAQRRERPSPR